MRKLSSVLIFSIALMFFTGCEKEQIQPDPLNASDEISQTVEKKAEKQNLKEDKFLPLKGEFEATIDAVTQVGIPGVQPQKQIVLAEGVMSHMGKTEAYMDQTWAGRTQPGPDDPWSWKGKGFGDITFTAANGDELQITYTSSSIHWDAYTGDPLEHYAELEYLCTIVGGTGRFTDASGEFTWEGLYWVEDNVGYATVTGKIKY